MNLFTIREQCELHVKVLLCAALVDGELCPVEEAYILSLAKLYGLTDAFVERERNTINMDFTEYHENVLNHTKTTLNEREKRCLVQDAISLSCTDDNFSDSEISFIHDLAKSLAVEKSTLNTIIGLNQQIIRLTKELTEILLINEENAGIHHKL